MPPRRPTRGAPQQSTAVKLVKLFFLLALAMGFKLLLSAAMRAYNIAPTLTAATAGLVASLDEVTESDIEGAGVQEVADDTRGPETPAQFVMGTINDNRVMVFSKSYCPYSTRCKAVLHKHLGEEGVAVVELDGRDDMGKLQDELQRITGSRTVPCIFVDGQFIGGADDVSALDGSGELEKMLRDKGLIGGAATAAAA